MEHISAVLDRVPEMRRNWQVVHALCTLLQSPAMHMHSIRRQSVLVSTSCRGARHGRENRQSMLELNRSTAGQQQ